MITADTISDEQIRELHSALQRAPRSFGFYDVLDIELAFGAIGTLRPNGIVTAARAGCAELLTKRVSRLSTRL